MAYFKLLLILGFSFLLFSCLGQDRVDIIIIPALKGQIFSEDQAGDHTGGISLISSLIKQNRKKHPFSLTLAANNTLAGSPEAFFTQGEMVVQALEELKVKALVMEAREFSFGNEKLRSLARQASFPFVAANLREQSPLGQAWFHPWYYDPDQALLLVGLVGPYFLQKNLEENVRNLELLDIVERTEFLLKNLPSLDPEPKTVGIIALGNRVSEEGEGFLWDLASIPGVDFVIQGSVKTYENPFFSRPRNQSSDSKQDPARIILLNTNDSDQAKELLHVNLGEKNNYTVETLAVKSSQIQPDLSLKDFLYRSQSLLESMLNEEISLLLEPLNHADEAESELGDLFTDLMKMHTDAEIAFINSGALRNNLQKGSLYLRQIYNMLPFGGNLVQGEIQGSTLEAILAHSLEFLGNPQKGRGFLQVSGIEAVYRQDEAGNYYLNPQDIEVNGEVLDPERWYRFASELFLVSGGDGYEELFQARNIRVNSKDLISLAKTWFQTQRAWSKPRGNRLQFRSYEPDGSLEKTLPLGD